MGSQQSMARGSIELICGNIVDQETDAIVNAANSKLAGGGGVDGAIHRAAGPHLLTECLKFPADSQGKRCPTGEVRTTEGGDLRAKYVIHAVGPYYREENAEEAEQLLREVHLRALEAAQSLGCRSIAFPAISTGAYRFPIHRAATIAIPTVREFVEADEEIELVRFVLFAESQFNVFAEALAAM